MAGSMVCQLRSSLRYALVFLVFTFVVIFVVTFVLKAHFGKEADEDEDNPFNKIMLPGDIIPLKYHLTLHANVTHTLNYTGAVKIYFEVKEETSDIILHSLDINHRATEVKEVHQFASWDNVTYTKEFPVQKTIKSKKYEQAMIRLEERLSAGKRYMLAIAFSAPLREQLRGFYKSSYVTPKGVKKYITTSHFKPTGARLAFPCFDEPSLKATFKVVLVHDHCCTALSNMPSEKKILDNRTGLITEYFQDSVKMSTYLVAFIVGEVSMLSNKTERGIKVNVYVPDYQISQAEYARNVTLKILDYYEKFFQLDFPLPKLDLIGIPDFGEEAMENWGLVTYRMTNLLLDPKETSNEAKRSIAIVIARGLAHQWFGNLVTMKWWSDLWLTEAFADFISYLGTDKVDPSWSYFARFNVQNLQNSMSVDSHLQTHPVKVPVQNPADIGSLVDHSITYNKGSSLICMLRYFMGAKTFGIGLNRYLRRFKYSNANSDDLWTCLSEGTSVPVAEIMNSWILTPGYPVITLRRVGKPVPGWYITQDRFLTDTSLSDPHKWDIPLTWYRQTNRNLFKKVFLKTYDHIHLKYEPGWLKMNFDHYGFYRVNYDEQNWRTISEQLQHSVGTLSRCDRSNLIDDAFALAKSGRISEALALDLMEYFPNETEWSPVKSATLSLSFLDFILSGRSGPGHELFQKYMVKQYSSLINKLGFQDTGSYQNKSLRTVVIKVAVEQNHPASVAAAKEMYQDWMVNGKKVPVNLRDAVYYAGIKYGGEKEWNFMFIKYKTTKVPTEKQTLMFALAVTSDANVLKKYLEMTLNDDIIKSQDSCYIINKIANNPIGRRMAYEYITQNWPIILKRYGQGVNYRDLVALFKGIFSTGKTESDLAEWERFFASHQAAGGQLAANQAKADIKNHIAWLKRSEKVVVDWLQKKVGHL